MPTRDQRCHNPQHIDNRLVVQHTADRNGPARHNLRLQRTRQRPGGLCVVRDIQHSQRPAGQCLEAPGQYRVEHSGADIRHLQGKPLGNTAERHDRAGRVVELIIATHCRVRQAGVHFIERAPGPAILQTFEIKIAVNTKQACTGCLRHLEQTLRRIRIAANGATPGAVDTRLLASDGLTVRAQPLGVIDADTAHNRNLGIPGVNRIQPPAQAHFKNGDLHIVLTEKINRRQRAKFEVGQRRFSTRGLNTLKRFA